MHQNDEKIFLIKKINKFFIKNHFNYKLFFCTYAKNIGFSLLNLFSNKKFIFWYNLRIILRDIMYSSYYNDIKIHKPKRLISYYKDVIVTWAYRKDFLDDGSFKDQVLNYNSKFLQKTLWFVIYMDKNLPSKMNNNIVLLTPFLKKKINILFLFLNFIKNINCRLNSWTFNLQLLSSLSVFADKANEFFIEFLNKDIKVVFMPYEAQPFQNLFFKSAKKISKNIKTVGYIHSPPEALPVQSIYKDGAPDKLILNGEDQAFCYKKYLGWRKKNFLILPSIRFKKNKNLSTFKNKIFLPFSITNTKNIIQNLKFLHSTNIIDIKKFIIQGHPLTKNTFEIIDSILHK